MSLHQLFCNNASIAEEQSVPFRVEFDSRDLDHVRALRLNVGEHIALVDASKDYFEVEIESVQGAEIWVRISQRLEHPRSMIPVTLVQGLAKGDKMDTVLRQATELGIDSFFPVIMQRSVVRLDQKKAAKRHERSCAIARSAALQSGRVSAPDVQTIRPLRALVESWSEHEVVLLFWEEAPLDQLIQPLFDSLQKSDRLHAFSRIWIIVGPEGGIASEEIELIEQSKAQVFKLSLGENILRTETAGVVACALVMNELRYRSEESV